MFFKELNNILPKVSYNIVFTMKSKLNQLNNLNIALIPAAIKNAIIIPIQQLKGLFSSFDIIKYINFIFNILFLKYYVIFFINRVV